jgi:hypothetical protein
VLGFRQLGFVLLELPLPVGKQLCPLRLCLVTIGAPLARVIFLQVRRLSMEVFRAAVSLLSPAMRLLMPFLPRDLGGVGLGHEHSLAVP